MRKWILASSKFNLLLILFPLLWRVTLSVLLYETDITWDKINRLENTVALLKTNLEKITSKLEQQNRHIETLSLDTPHGMYE
jgi:hypothetical protein